MGPESRVDRRTFLLATLAGVARIGLTRPQPRVTRPVVSEAACPLEVIAPVASDGYRGLAVLRKPPGGGPFPAIVILHGGIVTVPLARLESIARDLANPSRFLAAGYVVVAPTYRSRDADPQSPASLEDALAAVAHVRQLPYVDTASVVVYGCSGGGDLALQVAARTALPAVVAEEPASVLMAGVFNNGVPRKGERYTPEDSYDILEHPRQHYTPQYQELLRARIAGIRCPILILQGHVDRREIPVNRFNAEVLIPELRAAGKAVEVRTYPEQAHCFFAASGLPRPNGLPAPASWPAAALMAFGDVDRFCRRHLVTQPREIDAGLVTHVAVRVR